MEAPPRLITKFDERARALTCVDVSANSANPLISVARRAKNKWITIYHQRHWGQLLYNHSIEYIGFARKTPHAVCCGWEIRVCGSTVNTFISIISFTILSSVWLYERTSFLLSPLQRTPDTVTWHFFGHKTDLFIRHLLFWQLTLVGIGKSVTECLWQQAPTVITWSCVTRNAT